MFVEFITYYNLVVARCHAVPVTSRSRLLIPIKLFANKTEEKITWSKCLYKKLREPDELLYKLCMVYLAVLYNYAISKRKSFISIVYVDLTGEYHIWSITCLKPRKTWLHLYFGIKTYIRYFLNAIIENYEEPFFQ